MEVDPNGPTQYSGGAPIKMDSDGPPSPPPPPPSTPPKPVLQTSSGSENPTRAMASVKPEPDSMPRQSLKREASSTEAVIDANNNENLPSTEVFTARWEAAERRAESLQRQAEEVRRAADKAQRLADEAQRKARKLEVMEKEHRDEWEELKRLAPRLPKRQKLESPRLSPSTTIQREGGAHKEVIDLTGDD
ncbi:hypothetical protein JAAARDRAFT_62388 [Jaapia argillacea MUCL 33604]|uniref:Uncharacterized protein n=1 Tax=Jaapia argillacea MUCL 33604 TaxID=933084 RepID=A0A067P9V1_9AGAM|nr:hypothetical protein JAAARDRAFT_62388 [Jaapia argillacea MUCL 33604]